MKQHREKEKNHDFFARNRNQIGIAAILGRLFETMAHRVFVQSNLHWHFSD
jgi:hypothetical protein